MRSPHRCGQEGCDLVTARIDLDQLARRESEQTEWTENVADINDVVEVSVTCVLRAHPRFRSAKPGTVTARTRATANALKAKSKVKPAAKAKRSVGMG